MTELRLRRAAPSDCAGLQELQSRATWDIAGAHYSAAQVEAFLRQATPAVAELLAKARAWVFAEGDIPVACAAWHPKGGLGYLGLSCAVDPETAIIRSVFVSPERQRRGLAGALMRRVEQDALDAGARTARLQAMRGSEPFYLACGYRAVAPMSFDLDGVPFPGLEMAKPLAAACRAA